MIRMMASSWRTVMGMEERAEEAISAEWTWRRMETKCEESFSPASGERRGAQRLKNIISYRDKDWKGRGKAGSRFAIADITLHLLH